ncbi:sulfurtransferase TusA family protein [Psychrobacter sp. AOP22-C1-22]|uniref:sulfurtransferase TusA family protein n=1 Tax=unclassified Psychrobacter TaxID=196806 RepID=UPI001787D32E|nr:sulfurtransferase TusA family protein [Psychrobacter sp. FME6]MBE0406660.1 sulfurtransferase TusA family protein [Psychrobacter sp. FME6]
MSADSHSIMIRASYPILLSEHLPEAEQQSIRPLLELLPVDSDNNSVDDANLNDTTNAKQPSLTIKRFVDGRGLACPMPLLKTKVALRDVGLNESLYVVATDPNSQADIKAFCRQSQQTDTAEQLLLTLHNSTKQPPADSISSQRFDTIYHFIITKTDSN